VSKRKKSIEALKKWQEEHKGEPVKRPRWFGLSRRRAMDALCYECNNGSREDCEAPWCPLYIFRPQNKLAASLWWLRPKRLWQYAVRGGFPKGPGESIQAICLGEGNLWWRDKK